MAKKVSWMWGGKRYSGTLIRETKTHKFARTANGKTKKIKKRKVQLQKTKTRNARILPLVSISLAAIIG